MEFAVLMLVSSFGILLIPVLVQCARRFPAFFLCAHLVLGSIVPYWIGISAAGLFIPWILFSSAGLLFLFALAFRTSLNGLDIAFLILVGLCVIAVLFGGSSFGSLSTVLLSWGVPLALGARAAVAVGLQRTANMAVGLAMALSCWAIVEFVFDYHPFVGLTQAGGPWDVWSSVQYRGGAPRSEGAMGHSITLGNVLALLIPFVFASTKSKGFKAVTLLLILCAIATTFSRNALVAMVLAILLSLAYVVQGFRPGHRWTAILGAAAISAAGVALYLNVLSSAAGEEVGNSTAYRVGFLNLIPSVNFLGPASTLVQYAPDQWGYADNAYAGGIVRSVDSSVLLLALQFGWIPTTGLLIICAMITIRGLRRATTNYALISVIALLPTFVTTSMITQLPYFLWFAGGLGIAESARQLRDVSKAGVPRAALRRSPNQSEPSWAGASARRAASSE